MGRTVGFPFQVGAHRMAGGIPQEEHCIGPAVGIKSSGSNQGFKEQGREFSFLDQVTLSAGPVIRHGQGQRQGLSLERCRRRPWGGRAKVKFQPFQRLAKADLPEVHDQVDRATATATLALVHELGPVDGQDSPGRAPLGRVMRIGSRFRAPLSVLGVETSPGLCTFLRPNRSRSSCLSRVLERINARGSPGSAGLHSRSFASFVDEKSLRSFVAKFAPRPASAPSNSKITLIESIESIEALEESPNLCPAALRMLNCCEETLSKFALGKSPQRAVAPGVVLNPGAPACVFRARAPLQPNQN
jgi:hypothetical protein